MYDNCTSVWSYYLPSLLAPFFPRSLPSCVQCSSRRDATPLSELSCCYSYPGLRTCAERTRYTVTQRKQNGSTKRSLRFIWAFFNRRRKTLHMCKAEGEKGEHNKDEMHTRISSMDSMKLCSISRLSSRTQQPVPQTYAAHTSHQKTRLSNRFGTVVVQFGRSPQPVMVRLVHGL